MWNLLDQLSDQNVRRRLGLRFEAMVEEVFQVVRWAIVVGFVEFLSIRYPGFGIRALYLVLAVLLFGYLASRFLLRPEIRLFADPVSRWQRLVQSAFNFVICIVVFVLVMWGISQMVHGLSVYRLSM
ncbi:MAG: hypothetical protein RQ752_01210 [Thermohalobaculum sp.]|nr:hypothetical protein [Thermohalobaculum sp.]